MNLNIGVRRAFLKINSILYIQVIFITVLLSPLFSAAQKRYDILITEFLPDPTPSAGLPESEFIELTNHSDSGINLHNWKISNGNSSAVIRTDYILKADSLVILCNSSSAENFARYGSVLGITGFPSLNNEAGEIILSTDSGRVIHAIKYDRNWFDNELKSSGGWSLEMIDLSNPCSGKGNWTASISNAGGTPGKINSVGVRNPDEQPPSLLRIIGSDSMDLMLLFDEPVDSLSAVSGSDYTITNGIGPPDSAVAIPPFFDRIKIHLQQTLQPGKIYLVATPQICDCNGNKISLHSEVKAGLPEKVFAEDIIFNEILFNPPPYGYDYIELYNRSSKIIKCGELFLASRDVNGNMKDPVPLVQEDRDFFPGDYLLLTENPEWIQHSYPNADPLNIVAVSSLPSMPDDEGKIVLLNRTGEVVDELDYDHHWHSPLLAGETGVSLERIRPDLPTSLASNWTSAAATAGYGTPGYKNSEWYSDSLLSDFISIVPKLFSPDMDGYQDFCFINYKLPASGYIGSISIYDITGRLVNTLANNLMWGTSGSFRWDGLDDQENRLPIGHYVIDIELFLPDGTLKKQKTVCTLARRR